MHFNGGFEIKPWSCINPFSCCRNFQLHMWKCFTDLDELILVIVVLPKISGRNLWTILLNDCYPDTVLDHNHLDERQVQYTHSRQHHIRHLVSNNILWAAFAPISFNKKLQTQTTRKSLKNTYIWKWCSKNIWEIDTCSQLDQHFTSSFCTQIFGQKITKPNCE